MWRGILGIVAGWVAWGVLAQSFMAVLYGLFPQHFDSNGGSQHAGILVLMLALSVVYSLTAGAVTALIASENTMKYVWGLAIVNMATGILVQSMAWSIAPPWYHLIFLVLLIPMAVAGGRLGMRVKMRPQSA